MTPKVANEPKGTAPGKAINPAASANDSGTSPAHGLSKAKRKRLLIAAIALVGVAALLLWRHYAGWVSTDDAQIEAHLYPLSSRIPGHVLQVLVDNTQPVQAGQVLVQLDPTDYRAAEAQAEGELADARAAAAAAAVGVPIASIQTASQLNAAQAQVASAQAGIAAAQRQFEAAAARLREAEANNTQAQADRHRYAALVAKHEVSVQQYDHAVAAAQASAARVAALEALADAAHRQIKQTESQLAQSQAALYRASTRPQQLQSSHARAAAAAAAVQTAQARLQQAELNLQYCTIVAPVSGIVGNRKVVAGENIAPGQTLLTIVPAENLWVTANFKETDLQHMRAGDPAMIHVDAYGRNYRGHVFGISQATGVQYSLLPPENATGNYVKVVQRVPVKIVFDPGQDPQHRLRVGLSVEPRVRVR